MTLVHTPERKHSCDIDWETRPVTSGPFCTPGETKHAAYMVHRNDPPGTVRQCPECGKFWVAERNRPGMAGVFWRPEKRRERRQRERRASDERVG